MSSSFINPFENAISAGSGGSSANDGSVLAVESETLSSDASLTSSNAGGVYETVISKSFTLDVPAVCIVVVTGMALVTERAGSSLFRIRMDSVSLGPRFGIGVWLDNTVGSVLFAQEISLAAGLHTADFQWRADSLKDTDSPPNYLQYSLTNNVATTPTGRHANLIIIVADN